MNERADWTEILTEPMAIRGAYGGEGPSLGTFVLHATHAEPHQVSIAGEFTQLPDVVPSGWNWNGRPIAYVIFELIDLKSSSIKGVLSRGTPLPLSLESTSELWATAPSGQSIYYKRFHGESKGAVIDIVAAHIRVVAGQRAMSAYGWAKLPSNSTVETDARKSGARRSP